MRSVDQVFEEAVAIELAVRAGEAEAGGHGGDRQTRRRADNVEAERMIVAAIAEQAVAGGRRDVHVNRTGIERGR